MIADVSEFFLTVHMIEKQGLNMDQTDQTGFQEYYSKVSSLQIQHSVIGELLGWATKPVKKGDKRDKRANIPSQYRSSRLNKNCDSSSEMQ